MTPPNCFIFYICLVRISFVQNVKQTVDELRFWVTPIKIQRAEAKGSVKTMCKVDTLLWRFWSVAYTGVRGPQVFSEVYATLSAQTKYIIVVPFMV